MTILEHEYSKPVAFGLDPSERQTQSRLLKAYLGLAFLAVTIGAVLGFAT